MPLDLQQTIVGIVESPTSLTEPVTGHQLAVTGWAVTASGIASIGLRCNGVAMPDAFVGLRKPEVAAAFPGIADASRSGYMGVMDISGLAPGEHALEVLAVAHNGVRASWGLTFRVAEPDEAYAAWLARNEPPVGAPLQLQRLNFNPQAGPTLGVVIECDALTTPEALARTIGSLERQTYAAHEALTCAPAETAKVIGRLQSAFVGIVRAGNVFADFTLGLLAGNLAANPKMDLIYGDHDKFEGSRRGTALFKPAWSPRLLRGHDYIGRCWFARRSLLARCVADAEASAAGSHQRWLIGMSREVREVGHVASVLLSQVPTDADDLRVSRPAPGLQTARKAPKVSVIIPTRVSDTAILGQCLDGLFANTGYPELEVIVLPNNVKDWAAAEAFLSRWPVKVVRWNDSFNWSAINNLGADHATGELLLFLNDDVVPVTGGWLGAMVALAQEPDVGAVGAVLRYPNGLLQHAGVWLPWRKKGIDGRHTYRLCTGAEPALAPMVNSDREQTAVTGACLLSRRTCFDAVGGFDAALPLVFNDVDYCLRLNSLGWVSVISGQAVLTHHEGISRVGMSEDADYRLFMDRWGGQLPITDPYSNPHLDPSRDDWVLLAGAPPPLAARKIKSGKHTRALHHWTHR